MKICLDNDSINQRDKNGDKPEYKGYETADGFSVRVSFSFDASALLLFRFDPQKGAVIDFAGIAL